jgi:uncharacterized protein (UPF0335 family)
MPSKKNRVLAKNNTLTPVNQAQSNVEFFKAENANLRKQIKEIRAETAKMREQIKTMKKLIALLQ